MEPLSEPKKIRVSKEKEISLDTSAMIFNEATLSEFLMKEAVYYDHLGRAYAELDAVYQMRKLEVEEVQARAFDRHKSEGGSDKLCQSRADTEQEVLDAKKKMVGAQMNAKMVQQHLRAWDRAHENANNIGHTIRKEMDKLGGDIRERNDTEEKLKKSFGF